MSPTRFLILPVAAAALALGTFGCENMHPMNIPANAMVATEGNGVVTATAMHDGTVYVYDVNGDRLVYSGSVMKGDLVTVNTDQNAILVNSTVRQTKVLNTGDKHRIYFSHNPMMSETP